MTLYLEALPKMQAPDTGLELEGWTLVSQERALSTIREDTAKHLLFIYLRMRSADDLHKQLLDLMEGYSSLNVRLAAATTVGRKR